MTEDELTAVIAAATALFRSHAADRAAPVQSAWRLAARIDSTDFAEARTAVRSASIWSMQGRLHG